MTPAILNSLKPPWWCPGPCRTMQDHPGPSRTVQDNPGLDTDLTPDRKNFSPGQSGTVRDVGVTVVLLFDKAVYVETYNGDSQGEHWVYHSWSNPQYLACFIECLGPLFGKLLAKLVPWGWLIMMRLFWKKPEDSLFCALFGTAHLWMRRVVTRWGSVVGKARHWRDQPFYAIHKQLQWQFLESLCESKSYGCTPCALNDHHSKITRYAHRLSQLSLFLN